MQPAQQQSHYYSPTDYLHLEELAEYKIATLLIILEQQSIVYIIILEQQSIVYK